MIVSVELTEKPAQYMGTCSFALKTAWEIDVLTSIFGLPSTPGKPLHIFVLKFAQLLTEFKNICLAWTL